MGTGHTGPFGKYFTRTTANKSVNNAGPYIENNDLSNRLKNFLTKFIMPYRIILVMISTIPSSDIHCALSAPARSNSGSIKKYIISNS